MANLQQEHILRNLTITPAACHTEKEPCWEVNYWRVGSGQEALRHKIDRIRFGFFGTVGISHHGGSLFHQNLPGTAKYMKTAVFITIQDKCKITFEHFAVCTYSIHKIKTYTWVSFNFQPKVRGILALTLAECILSTRSSMCSSPYWSNITEY